MTPPACVENAFIFTALPQPVVTVSDWSHVSECASRSSGRYTRATENVPSSLPSRFYGDCDCPTIGAEAVAGAGCAVTDLWLEGVYEFPDRGGQLSRNLYVCREGSVDRLVFRRPISMVRATSGKSEPLEATRAVLRQKRENVASSIMLRAAEVTVEGAESGSCSGLP